MAELKGQVAPEQMSTNSRALSQLKSGREGKPLLVILGVMVKLVVPLAHPLLELTP